MLTDLRTENVGVQTEINGLHSINVLNYINSKTNINLNCMITN